MITKKALSTACEADPAPGPTLAVSLRDVAEIRPYERNPRLNEGNMEEPVQYEGDYLVYSDGRVYSNLVGRFLKPRKHTKGYLRYQIHRKDHYIHRIVAACYIPNPHSRDEINHIDGDKTNNHVNNLEWSTRSENNKHAFATGLRDYAELKAMANSERHRAAQRRRRKYDEGKLTIIRGLTSGA